MTRWHLALLGLLGVALLAFLLIPIPLTTKLGAVSFGICPQRASHSYFLGGRQLPLEARMTGIFGGFLLTLVYLTLLGRGRANELPPVPWIVVLTAFLPLMALDGANNFAHDLGLPHLYAPDNRLRLTTGVLTGLTFAAVLLPIFNFAFWKPTARQPSMAHGRELLGAIAIGGVFAFGVARGHSLLFYPISLISTASVVVLIAMVNTVLILAVTRREGTGQSLWQLLPVVTLALVLTTAELGLLSLLRWLTIGTQPLP